MKAGTVLFNGADLALYGSPRFTLRRTPEPAAPAIATHRRVDIIVTVDLRAEMPATVWARAEKLQSLLASAPEGLLEIRSENGTVRSWQATPGACSLPEAISRRGGRVDMTFSAREPITAGSSPLELSIDPLDGSPVIVLDRPQDWSESIRQNRPDSRHAHRAEISSTLAFSARTAYADPLLSLPARAAFLIEEARRLEAIASKEGRVVFAGFDRIVQFESLSAKPSPGWEWIDLEAQARYVTLPGETEAEMDFTEDAQEDPATGETRTTVSGKVKAPDKATATAKVDALLAVWRTDVRRVVKISKKDSYLDGADEATSAAWVGLDFTLEFSEGSADGRYSVKIDTREGPDGARTTYSGSAYATTLEILLATIETASGDKHPVEVRSEISVEYATDDEGAEKLMQGTFTREYATAAGKIRGTLAKVTNHSLFTDWLSTVSGSISAPSYAIARAVARKFIPDGVMLRQDEETQDKAFTATYSATPELITTAEQMVTLAFNYSWATNHTSTAIQYEETVTPDYTRMVQETSVAGTCWAASKSVAETAVAALLSSMGLSNPSRKSLTHAHERQVVGSTINDDWLSFRFSHTFEGAITGAVGFDIIEASYALQRIGMVDHEPITEIPLAYPVKQIPFGPNMGRMVASGTVKARVKITAVTWGQAKRANAATSGGATGAADPPDERIEEIYLPFNGTTVACYQFTFQYGYRYASGLTGLM